jgi:hypothetical protein
VHEPNVPKTEKKMKPIWYFVGLVLLSMGSLVFLTGIYILAFGLPHKTVLAGLHPNVWWGAIMVATGALFFAKNR